MKLHEHFKTFLDEHVNLNATRIEQLENSIEAVKTAVKESDWGAEILRFAPQGSWAHQTIIKPLPDKEFDADLLVFVKPKDGWTPKDYVNKLATALESNSTYKDKLRRYSHCVTIEYAGVRRIDIAPCVVDRQYQGQFEVCNRNAGESGTFEASAPTEYTQWVIDKNNIAGGNDLKKVTRLLKYMRDIKGNFTCPSFLFTTLLGYQVYDHDKDSAAFADLPTTLKTLVGRLDDWLQARPTVPMVRNPKLWSENQSSGWTETQYSNFRDKINLYRGWIDEAYDEEDRDESIGKWQRVFGDKFAVGEAKEAARVSESVAKAEGALVSRGYFSDLVERVKALGAQAVPAKLVKLPYVKRPKWRFAETRVTVNVSAELYASPGGSRIRQVASLAPLQPDQWIKFTAKSSMGVPFPPDYTVKWRVTNTDTAAYNAGELRGDFYDSDSGASRMEHLAFRGVHFVEAFVVRKSDNRLLGQSQPFYVVIE
ncbi:nucleotidyltransferase [Noviherbaspirillum sp. UKPF54]|uniref:nucleotidyltransferase n=1 Tax=Noviherbaspirillum sp. UKPF54 TaxID=2601898 RepID=UPI0011B1C1D3|nr:nucleotidyltransferase [Noviherbaspirillum sp. UKPF54]QDZ28699.1 nucleotidyltransferase [Noviherbaspirillum sp. UKPF54]